MAARTGTVQRRGVVGVREDLSDMISNVTPTGFVAMQNMPTGPALAQTYTEWQTDEDRAGVHTNRVEEGRVTQFSRPTTTTRLGNYCQISEESLSVSGTMEAVSKIAGRGGRESTRLLMKKMRELQRDMEYSIWRNPGASASSNKTQREQDSTTVGLGSDETRIMGGLRSFVKTNFRSVATSTAKTTTTNVRNYGPVTGTWDGTPTYASNAWSVVKTGTNPTLGAFEESDLRALLTDMFSVNEMESYDLVVGPQAKTMFSGFDGVATHTHNVSGSTKPIVADSIDVYVGDFHQVTARPSRHVWPVDAFLMDWQTCQIRYLRPVGTERLAKRGDSKEWLVNTEYTLCVKNEKSLGAFTDINVSTRS